MKLSTAIIVSSLVLGIPLWALAWSGSRETMFADPVHSVLTPAYSFNHNTTTWATSIDIDLNGIDDLAMIGKNVNATSGNVILDVYWSDGLGAFVQQSTEPLTIGTNSNSTYMQDLKLLAGHFNNDQWPDLAILTVTDGSQSFNANVLLNNGGTGFRCAGDVDNDGVTRTPDLLLLLEDWGCVDGE